MELLGRCVKGIRFTFGKLSSSLAADGANGALEITQTCFARIVANDVRDRLALEFRRHFLVAQSVVFELARDEMTIRDLDLLFLRISREVDDFHSVFERGGDGVHHIPGRDEEDLREIERKVNVVIPERVVLLRIENFEKRRARVAAKIHPELVDLVEHEHGVLGARAAQVLDNLPWKGADIGSPVAPDLRLVANPAEAHPDELAPERFGDGFPETRLADAGRAHEAQDRPFDVGLHLPHGQKLEDAIFHFYEVVVISLENFVCFRDVVDVLGSLRPGNAHEPIEIGASDGIFSRGGRDLREAIQLARRLLLRLFGHLRFLDLLA